jgi:hypothetical protein
LAAALLSTASFVWAIDATAAGVQHAPDGRRVGCRVPIGDVPGVTRSWVVEQTSGAAQVAWCARSTRGQLVYDLVVSTASQRHPWASCPSHIRLGINHPYPELRAVLLPRDLPYPMTLRKFWYLRGDDYLADQGPRVDSDDTPTGPAIDFGAGGAGQILLCLGKRWIMAGYH